MFPRPLQVDRYQISSEGLFRILEQMLSNLEMEISEK